MTSRAERARKFANLPSPASVAAANAANARAAAAAVTNTAVEAGAGLSDAVVEAGAGSRTPAPAVKRGRLNWTEKIAVDGGTDGQTEHRFIFVSARARARALAFPP